MSDVLGVSNELESHMGLLYHEIGRSNILLVQLIGLASNNEKLTLFQKFFDTIFF